MGGGSHACGDSALVSMRQALGARATGHGARVRRMLLLQIGPVVRKKKNLLIPRNWGVIAWY